MKRKHTITAITEITSLPLTCLSHARVSKETVNRIEEVIVTVRRTEQTTPVTISVFPANQIKKKSISTPEDLQMNVLGIRLTGSSSRDNVVYQSCGRTKSVVGGNPPAVVSYFAEVPWAFA